jgi:hypothetical protein
MITMDRKPSAVRHYMRGSLKDVAASAHAFVNASEDMSLFELAEELHAADHTLQAARTELARAERKLQRLTLFPGEELPGWFVAREDAEAAARILVDTLCEEIATAPVRSRAGLAIKLRVLAALFQDDPSLISDPVASDGAQALLKSILDSGRSGPGSYGIL